ncbi:MAG: hypothetical protein IT439_07885 [Phycisphaerales bacterium]|nr:hypothetical protein [Phycisphaerales bacterium]
MTQVSTSPAAGATRYPIAGWFKGLLIFLGVLCCITVIGILIGIPIFILAARYREERSGDAVTVVTHKKYAFNLSEVASVEARAVSGGIAKKMAPHTITLKSGKKAPFPVGAFQNGEQLLAEIKAAAGAA